MKWPWRRRPKPDIDEAQAARKEAERKLAETCGRQDEIDKETRKSREWRVRNSFAEMIFDSMKPPPKPEDRR